MASVASVMLAEMLISMKVDFKGYYSKETGAVTNVLLQILLTMFGANGDKIAQQYAGSDAFHKAEIYLTDNGSWQTKKQHIAMKAVRR